LSDLLERMKTEALRSTTSWLLRDMLTEAAAEIRRLVLLSGQADLDRCDEVLRLRGELAAARMDGLPDSPNAAAAAAWRPEWIDGLGVVEDEVE
jgi:hypothetical protein